MSAQIESVDTLDFPFLWQIHQRNGLNEEIFILACGFRLQWNGFVFLGRGEVKHHGRRMVCGGVQQFTSGEWEADEEQDRRERGREGA